MAWENYGLAFVIDQRVALDANGTIVAWDYEGWSPTLGGRPGDNAPGNVVTGFLAGFRAAAVRAAHARAAAAGRLRQRLATPRRRTSPAASARNAAAAASCKSERVLTHTVESPFFTGPLRSPARLQNTFAHECFMDEIAALVKADPVEYRLRHLRDPRLKNVVEAAAKTAGWDARPSPRAGAPATGVVTRPRRRVRALRRRQRLLRRWSPKSRSIRTPASSPSSAAWWRRTAGPISNPDGMRNQIEGGALQGLSRALLEEVTWDDREGHVGRLAHLSHRCTSAPTCPRSRAC